MKTKATLFLGAVVLVTLSFTFAEVKEPARMSKEVPTTTSKSEPIGGLYADVVE